MLDFFYQTAKDQQWYCKKDVRYEKAAPYKSYLAHSVMLLEFTPSGSTILPVFPSADLRCEILSLGL